MGCFDISEDSIFFNDWLINYGISFIILRCYLSYT
jgi:hypothetical protein